MSDNVATPPPPPPASQSWFSQNARWFIPTAIGVGCLLPMIVFGGCIAAIIAGATSAAKNSVVYRQAVETAKTHPKVVAALGQPVQEGKVSNPSINSSNGVTTVDVTVEMSGPNKSGQLRAVGTESNAAAQFRTLTMTVDGQQLDLLVP